MRARQEKETILNLQPISRAAARVALIAMYVAGAGSFPTQPVAGQETNTTLNKIIAQTFAQTRPGAKTKARHLTWDAWEVGNIRLR
jgi:hypothetical protein